ncbi:MAG: WD40 repeat domain-containing protein [Chloroflexi bacterium]|nr:WD40 repeat domain-containing protein [Chloroflexota bacterium]
MPITADTAVEVMNLMAVGPGRAYDVAFAPNGKLIAVASSKGVKLYETGAFGAEDLLDRENGRSVVRLAFAPDAQTIVALDPGYNVRMLDTNSGEAIFDEYPDDLGGSLTAVAVSPDQTTYAIGASDFLDLYAFDTHEQLFQASGHAHIITAIDYSPDGSTLRPAVGIRRSRCGTRQMAARREPCWGTTTASCRWTITRTATGW